MRWGFSCTVIPGGLNSCFFGSYYLWWYYGIGKGFGTLLNGTIFLDTSQHGGWYNRFFHMSTNIRYSNCPKQIISHESFPLVGHLYMYAKAPMEKLLESREKFGEIFRQDSGFIPTVWLCNYEDIITALKQDSLQHRNGLNYWVKEKNNLTSLRLLRISSSIK